MHTINIDFNASRWQNVQHHYQQWWSGETNCPMVHLTLKGRDPGRAEPDLPSHDFASFYDLNVPVEAIVDRWLYDLECRKFLGDAFPLVFPNFGPGVIAAFMGLELRNGKDTVWFHQPRIMELADIQFQFDPGNIWFRRVCDLYRSAVDRFGGLVHLGMTDLGGNLDIVSSFRPGEDLLVDLYDAPETVAKKVWHAHEMWWRYFNELNVIIQQGHPGYSSWTPLYSQTPYYMLQCDFCYMISREMFDEFARPELEATCRKLSNPFYHLDGPGQLTHLDSLLEIPQLKGIQWVPGAGRAGVTGWPEVYRKIRGAGKRIQFFTSQDPMGWRALDVMVEQLGSAAGIMMCGEAPAEDEPEIRQMLKKYGIA